MTRDRTKKMYYKYPLRICWYRRILISSGIYEKSLWQCKDGLKKPGLVGEQNHCVRLLGEQSPWHIKEHNHRRREAICARESQIPRTSESRESESTFSHSSQLEAGKRIRNHYSKKVARTDKTKQKAAFCRQKEPQRPLCTVRCMCATSSSSREQKKLLLIGRTLTKCRPGVSYLASFMRAFNSQGKLVHSR
jgi:hypothetical protein